ncbi:LLM class F420-dependent oxidoreductase [Wenjunlia tyrosinilytica]|uniref:LLM class F420-dependent oxidoreductase n=1 Tax=Wenjunlia tyrosinilytica TaxID=1544741 RepID=A0A918DWX0_9ACTN|nr:LLM class F420-dependent oxidoreductase [Wenjunlia tyrosinilytica]GGO88271.1 LLM class F420-dependent oxidoreductase [Wenjunlia tyrosinilytica]
MTTPQPRWGLTYPLDGVPLAEQRRLVESLPDLGFTDVWSTETAGADAFTPLALASVWAPALRLGTAIVPVHTRGPALIAMQAAAMAEAAPGRFALGLGASSPVIVEHWNSLTHDRPYQRCRDTLGFLREALTGQAVTQEYETFEIDRFRLERVPDQNPALLLGALRPGMLRLAAREADGVILNWLGADDVPTALAEFHGAGGEGKEVVARVFVCPTEDISYARKLGRRLIAGYLTVPAYAQYQRWLGRGEALKPMWDAWSCGDRRQAASAVPDEVVDALVLHGSPERCREELSRYAAHGVTTVVPALLPTPGDPAAALPAAVAAVAPAA